MFCGHFSKATKDPLALPFAFWRNGRAGGWGGRRRGFLLLQAGGCVQGSDFAGGRKVTPLPSPRGGACGPAPLSWRQGDSPSSAEAWCLGLAAPGSWRASGICPVQCHGLRLHPRGDSVGAPAVAPPGASMGPSAPRWGGSLCGLSGHLTGCWGTARGRAMCCGHSRGLRRTEMGLVMSGAPALALGGGRSEGRPLPLLAPGRLWPPEAPGCLGGGIRAKDSKGSD